MESINISEDDFDIVTDDGKEQVSWNRDPESTTSDMNYSTDICQSPLIYTSSIIAIMILILHIYIGWRYSDACPISPLISYYLIIAGIGSLALILLIFFTRIIIKTFAKNMSMDRIDRTNSNRTTALIRYGVHSVMCINLSLFLFLISWTIIGWIWVILVWHRVQYRRAEADNYCHSLLYQFSFSFLLLTTTFKLAFLCCIRRKLYSRIFGHQRKDTLTSNEAYEVVCD